MQATEAVKAAQKKKKKKGKKGGENKTRNDVGADNLSQGEDPHASGREESEREREGEEEASRFRMMGF